jgi:hypothetical protein
MSKKGLIIEMAIIFVLVELRIWFWFKGAWQYTEFIPIAIAIWSWYRNKDNLRTLGLIPESISWKIGIQMVLSILLFIGGVMAYGMLFNYDITVQKISHPDFLPKYLTASLKYLPWAFLQQLFVNGYLTNRLYQITESRGRTIFLVGFLFAIVHLPNPAATIVTFFGGMMVSYFFLQAKNLYILAIPHALIGKTFGHILGYTLKVGGAFLQ